MEISDYYFEKRKELIAAALRATKKAAANGNKQDIAAIQAMYDLAIEEINLQEERATT